MSCLHHSFVGQQKFYDKLTTLSYSNTSFYLLTFRISMSFLTLNLAFTSISVFIFYGDDFHLHTFLVTVLRHLFLTAYRFRFVIQATLKYCVILTFFFKYFLKAFNGKGCNVLRILSIIFSNISTD